MKTKRPSVASLEKFFRAQNYISAAQIFLQDNYLLEEPLSAEDIKPRLLGHWGTCPGINFTYLHLNQLIKRTDANMLFVLGPGHGFPAVQTNVFMEGTLSKYYKEIPYNFKGLTHMIRNFSWAYGYPSHSNPGTPGCILEGGELGYSLSTSFGAVLDNPDLIVGCLVGDGEAETGPTATAWHCNKLLSPKTDGAVLPILHLNEYKISGPTIYGRMSDTELTQLFTGYGYQVHIVDLNKKQNIHTQMMTTLDKAHAQIKKIQNAARSGKKVVKPKWPMIILRTPKGWTGIKTLKGRKVENNFFAHQVVVTKSKSDIAERTKLDDWLRSYNFHELYDKDKGFIKEIKDLLPKPSKRMGMNKHAFGGEVRRSLKLPDLKKYALTLPKPGSECGFAMHTAGKMLRDIFTLNKKEKNFRLMCPDETYSNKLHRVFEVTSRVWEWPIKAHDEDLKPEGRVMEMLSEHTLQGLLQGYILTGRHGMFASYEAFLQIISSMADQYAKFIKASQEFPWRKPVSSFNYILSSLGWRQDHNGFSHQNPGFVSNTLEKDGYMASVYFPVDVNSTLAVFEECLKSKECVNVIVVGKQCHLQWQTLDEARKQVKKGIGTWRFASDSNPDIIFSSAGDYPTIEAVAAIDVLKKELPDVKVRYVNVSEMTSLGVSDPRSLTTQSDFDAFFTKDKPVVFNYHGYVGDVKQLVFDNGCAAKRFHIHGYQNVGSTTTPFDMRVRNKIDRFSLVIDAVCMLEKRKVITKSQASRVKTKLEAILKKHKKYVIKHGVDPKCIEDWVWGAYAKGTLDYENF